MIGRCWSHINFSLLLSPVLLELVVGGGSAGGDVVMAGFCKYVDKVLGRTVECRAQARAAHTQCVTSSSSSSLPTPTCNHSRPQSGPMSPVSYQREGRRAKNLLFMCVYLVVGVRER